MSMFCFQCEQRGKYKGADGTLLDGCTVCGVCGKKKIQQTCKMKLSVL